MSPVGKLICLSSPSQEICEQCCFKVKKVKQHPLCCKSQVQRWGMPDIAELATSALESGAHWYGKKGRRSENKLWLTELNLVPTDRIYCRCTLPALSSFNNTRTWTQTKPLLKDLQETTVLNLLLQRLRNVFGNQSIWADCISHCKVN